MRQGTRSTRSANPGMLVLASQSDLGRGGEKTDGECETPGLDEREKEETERRVRARERMRKEKGRETSGVGIPMDRGRSGRSRRLTIREDFSKFVSFAWERQ